MCLHEMVTWSRSPRKGPFTVDHIDVKRVYVDGKGVGDLDGEALRDRETDCRSWAW